MIRQFLWEREREMERVDLQVPRDQSETWLPLGSSLGPMGE